MIQDVGPGDAGHERTLALHAEDVRPSVVPWQNAEAAFAFAVIAIALHAVDTRSIEAAGRGAAARWTDALLALALAGVAVGLFRRAGRPVRAVLALLIGTWATIAGLGITAAHIWKLGFSGADVTGILSLVAGLVLLGLAAVVILQRVRGWRRLLALPVGLLSVAYVFTPAVIAVFVTHMPPTMLGGNTPADEGLRYRDVTLTTADGVRLAGWYVPSRNHAAVIVLHGSGSSRLNILDHVGVLGRAGYGVLAIDARGHGRSGGVAMDLGWDEDLDVEAGVSFLARQTDVDAGRIGVLGLSMGGVGAVEAAASDGRINAVVAEGVAVATVNDALSLPPDRWWHVPFYWTAGLVADLLSPAEPPRGIEEAVSLIAPRPVLLISGRGDDEAILNRAFAAAASAGTELLELPDTKHSQGIWWHTDEWSRRVLGFLDRALLP